jgi:hypothetical protein
MVGEVLTTALTIGAIVFLQAPEWFTDPAGAVIPLFHPGLWSGLLPLLVVILVAIAVLQVIVFLAGRWTMPFAAVHAVLQLAFAVPVVGLALTGSLINPAFAEALGWPALAEGRGIPMVVLAASVAGITGWEIVSAFRRASRSR